MAIDFGKIKRLFVVEEENQQNTQTPQNKTTNPSTQKSEPAKVIIPPAQVFTPTPETTTTTQNHNTSGKFNEKIFEQLMLAITNANLPGEDYLEFVAALKAMDSLPLDENIKIQTVVATLSTRGMTLQRVFESADYYLKILENEREKFNIALNQKNDSDLKARLNEAQNLEAENKKKEEQIELLKQEIAKNKEAALRIKNDVAQAQQKIKETADSFQLTYTTVADQIKNNVQKIKRATGQP